MPSTSPVTCLIEARDLCGESMVFDERRGALVWVDIVGKRIHRLTLTGGRHELWPTGEFPTSIGLRTDGGAVVGLTRRVTLWDFDGDFRTLAVPEPDQPDNRLNEGCVAPDGSFRTEVIATIMQRQSMVVDPNDDPKVFGEGRKMTDSPNVEGTFARDEVTQRAPFEKFHHVVGDAVVGDSVVENADRVGVGKLDRRLYLAFETLGQRGVAIGAEQFDDCQLAEARVAHHHGEVHRGHAALPE